MMYKEKYRRIMAYIAIAISLVLTLFWAFWGINEFFHEGWYSPTATNVVFLFFVQYLSFTIIFIVLALLAARFRRSGLAAYIVLGFFSAWFFAGSSFEVAYLSLAIPFILLGLLFYFSDFSRIRYLKCIIIIPPVLVVLGFGTPLLIRNLSRVDDGNYGTRIVACQGESLVWAPTGPGWPEDGASWTDAMYACAHLSKDGDGVLADESGIWRLPSVAEAVMCQEKHGENAGGVWNAADHRASYDIVPDKETPLWRPASEIVYYWTSEMSQETDGQAYIFTYDGGIFDKDIRYAPNTQSFRCIKDLIQDEAGIKDRDEAIREYLVSQKDFAWQTEEGTKNACVFENLGGDEFPLSLWVYCSEYRLNGGQVEELSGSSGPVLVDYPSGLGFYDIGYFSYQAPRDGKLYYGDIQDIFPKDLQNDIFTYRGQVDLRRQLEAIVTQDKEIQDVGDGEGQVRIPGELNKGNGLLPPLTRAAGRVTKKPFGAHIAPATSPVQPERFSGYHTGTDFEVFPDELDTEVPVSAVCSGKLAYKGFVNGYGGVAVHSCELDGEPVTVLYGHLDIDSITYKKDEEITAGEELGILGDDKSPETDGERKHLHLSIHKGANIVYAGYTDSPDELSEWLDPCDYLCDE